MSALGAFALPPLPTTAEWAAVPVAGAFADPRLWANLTVLATLHQQLGEDAVIHSFGVRPARAHPPRPSASSPYVDPTLPPHALLLHLPSGAPAATLDGSALATAVLVDARQPIAGLDGGAPALEILYTRPWFVDPAAPRPCLRMTAEVYGDLTPALQPLWARVGSRLARAR